MADKDENPLQQLRLTRRNFMQTIGLAAAGNAASVAPAWTQTGNEPQSSAPGISPEKAYTRKTFTDQQWRTVYVVCDLIIPADDRSGSATQAGVPEFIDDWIDFRRLQDGNDRLRAQVFGGLMWLDSESFRLFATPFADAKPEQQRKILDRIAWPERVSREDHRWMLFFTEFRNLVISGFYSSKMGVADLPYLGNTVVEKWTGCSDEIWHIVEERRRRGYQGIRLEPGTEPRNDGSR